MYDERTNDTSSIIVCELVSSVRYCLTIDKQLQPRCNDLVLFSIKFCITISIVVIIGTSLVTALAALGLPP